MFSSASDDLTSAYAGSEWLGRHLQLRLRLQFSFTSAVRTLRRQLRGRQVSKPGGDDPDSAELSNVFDHESCPSGSDDSVSQAVPCQGETQIETSSKKRRLRMMDEDSDGVRIKIIPCVKQQFRRRMEATKVLDDGFYVPNRAQLMLSFLQKHGDRIVQETLGPRQRFPSTLKLVQHVLQKSSAGHRQ